MDFAKEARKLADEVLPENTSVKATLAFIEKIAAKLEAAHEAGRKSGVKEGKEKASRYSGSDHADWCRLRGDTDCLGQCMVR